MTLLTENQATGLINQVRRLKRINRELRRSLINPEYINGYVHIKRKDWNAVLEKLNFLKNTNEYCERRKSEALIKMHESTHNGQLYEFYKGVFLSFREVLDIKYRYD